MYDTGNPKLELCDGVWKEVRGGLRREGHR